MIIAFLNAGEEVKYVAKNWYPIIDKDKCIQCYQCVNFCPHDVYTIGDDGYPDVVNPD
ncbi:MAG: 4Fe-4S ferredoxin iron-sulfur binding protein, partial [Thermoanaerobacter sp.]|nr:4Fe-4S ferredoxin iron-sulfur binding protein [Thermoanaerobacter sp.]